jgi:hypothetical protein
MANVIETAKAATVAYNEKNWDEAKAVFVEKGIYDEKATGRRIQGIAQIIEAAGLGQGHPGLEGDLRRRVRLRRYCGA